MQRKSQQFKRLLTTSKSNSNVFKAGQHPSLFNSFKKNLPNSLLIRIILCAMNISNVQILNITGLSMNVYKVAELKLAVPNSAPVSVDYRRALAKLCDKSEWNDPIFVVRSEDDAVAAVSNVFVKRIKQHAIKHKMEHIEDEYDHSHVELVLSEQAINADGYISQSGFTKELNARVLDYVIN